MVFMLLSNHSLFHSTLSDRARDSINKNNKEKGDGNVTLHPVPSNGKCSSYLLFPYSELKVN